VASGTLPSDPLIALDAGKSEVQDKFIVLQWLAWHVSGGIALDLTVGTDPDVCTSVALKDLPGASGPRTGGTLAVSIEALPYRVEVEPVQGGLRGSFWLVISYSDEWGCRWESRRRVEVLILPETEVDRGPVLEPIRVPRARTGSTQEFMRRIVSLPPKRLASPPSKSERGGSGP